MDIKKMYYTLDLNEFNTALKNLKESSNTLVMLKNTNKPLYYVLNDNSLKLELNKLQWEFDNIISLFNEFTRRQIIQSMLIEEINATNKIENIHTTTHDVFTLLNTNGKKGDHKVRSITNSYALLMSFPLKIDTPEKLRELYDMVLKDGIDKADTPDGKLFRKGTVDVMDGIQSVHNGIYPESMIIESINDFLEIYNSNMETYEKAILTHYLFEYIHPFYDGNGRLGRFLMTYKIYNETDSIISFYISSSLLHTKTKYNRAFKEASDVHQYGFINVYVEVIFKILIGEFKNIIESLKSKKERISNYDIPNNLTKTQEKIFKFILESSYFSTYGVTNDEIIDNISVSKRSVISTIKYFRKLSLLEETEIGVYTYHKIKKLGI